MMNRILLVCGFLICLAAGYAQDTLRPMSGNATLMQAWKKRQMAGHAQAQKNQSVTAQFLPFADDFSYAGPYPDPNKWVNSTSVFVNHTKATLPITIGVATFDGLRADGYPYNPAYASGSYPSDTLTSIPLRLDSLNGLNIVPSDSVTLRFYYQARGVWESPDTNDDFYLEFFNVNTGQWDAIWNKGAFNPGSNNSFTRVMIPITDTTYLKNGFQFRFRNYSTACGDVDHWHIDAVYMDKKLNPARDTIVPEISFAFDPNPILKNYSQMPFKQFSGASDMQDSFRVYNNLRNNYTTGVNLTTYYEIRNNTGVVVAQNTNGTNNVPPFGSGGYCNNPPLVSPSLNSFTYNNGPFADSTSFLLKFYATNTSDNVHTNDTIYYHQNFQNYFAYDDGSAEAGYGFTSNGGATVVRYKLNAPDTLRAVDIFFDPILSVNLLENAGIKVRVWADYNNLPGNRYADSSTWSFPVYSRNGFDVFQRYQLVTPITFTNAATFYIGVEQQLGINLNIGYDLNYDSHTNVLFNSGSGWNVSSYKGSLMMRPVFGDSLRAVGIEQHNKTNSTSRVLIYPNPATDEFYVQSAVAIKKVTVCDMLGNILLESTETHMNIASLPNGMYLVRTITAQGYSDTQKLLIAR